MIDQNVLEIKTKATFDEAYSSYKEGGIPIGSALLIEDKVIATGHNRRVQQGSNILHGETDCIENAGHKHDLTKAVLFTSLSPCSMCAGAILLYQIPIVVILDATNVDDYPNSEQYLKDHGVEGVIHPHEGTIDLNQKFQHDPNTRRIWLGDIGK